MKTVLITGAAGLIGSRLADWITENHPEVEVIGIDDLSGGYLENVNPKIKFYQLDLATQSDTINYIFNTHKPDLVYHFAAYAAEALSPFIRTYNYTNNLVATAHLINASIKHNIKRFVFTSSMAVYGQGNPPFAETSSRNPIDPYGVAKMACEMDIEIANTQHGLDYCIIRPHNMYGAKQNIWDSYRNVLGIWMYKQLNNQPFLVFGDGLQTRAFSYIDDALPAFWRAGTESQASRQIINLGGVFETTIKDAAYTLAEVVGGAEIIHMPPRHEVKHAFPTFQKSVDLLGFEHKTNLREGLEKMWEWVLTQPARPRQIWSEYELEVGIYDYWKKDTLISQAPTTTLR